MSTKQKLMPMRDKQAAPPETLSAAFHRCWGIAADLPGYCKEEWKTAQQKLLGSGR